MKKISLTVLLSTFGLLMFAQSGINSPYSQYGLGQLADQSGSLGRSMNGIGISLRDNTIVNPLNPASYSQIDSLTFLFDIGMSGQLTNFKEGGKSVNAKNADIDYVMAGLRLAKRLGLSFGILPYTNIGYNYSTSHQVGNSSLTNYQNNYTGNGGLHQAYIGLGWGIFKPLSFGINVSYIWGSLQHQFTNVYNDKTITSISENNKSEVRNYKLDLGLQYAINLTKKDILTLGFTYGYGHNIGGKPEIEVISSNAVLQTNDTAHIGKDLFLELPTSYGAGFSWSHQKKITFAAEYSLQQWSKVKFPQYSMTNNEVTYQMTNDNFKDRHKFNLGMEFCPNPMGRKYHQLIRYRAGISYTTPYVKINGKDGPDEMSASIGFGIPIINTYNNKSMLNISAQWVKASAPDMINENTFRINVGLTFNERWFMKWKMN